MDCVVFDLIPTPCKSDGILCIIIIRRIKYMFMRVTIQILYALLETLETSKSRFHSPVYHTKICVANVNSDHNINVMYMDKSMSKFITIIYLCLTKGIFC